MDPERWEQVARIYDGAAEQPPAERGAYLDEACRGDDALRHEVESLLGQEGTPVLIDRPALESARDLLQPDAPLASGTRLGPYEIADLIGSGGMGRVYRATDTRLNRRVAIKVLSGAIGPDPEARERFLREGRAIAALTHPHICTVHDVGQQALSESGPVIDFLVMEYVDGEALSARLARAPLPLHESLRYAIQIASALDKAHGQGIVHRDLKPGNVMLTKAGAKLLDFGLARIVGSPILTGAAPGAPASAHLTSPGTVLGTFQYMAPEQLDGQDADARTDMFAFGTVVYEMLTGAKAFHGKSQASLIGAIMQADPPPVSARQPLSPPALDRVISTCLAKDPDARWQNAGDLTRELRWIAESASPQPPAIAATARRRLWPRSRLAWAAAVVLGLAGLLAAARMLSAPRAIDLPVTRFSFALPEGSTLTSLRMDSQGGAVPMTPVAVSHDGRRIAYSAVDRGGQQHLWIRSLDRLESQRVDGTEGGTDPFWSPDDRFLGFFADDTLKKVPVSGGGPMVIANAPDAQGGSWGPDDTIVFSSASVINRVAAGGGQPSTIVERQAGQQSLSHPQFLPRGRHIVYHALRLGEPHVLFAMTLDSGTRTQIMLADAMNVAYARDHLFFVQGTSLMALRFNASDLAVEGQPFLVAGPVQTQSITPTTAVFSASENGVLVYLPAGAASMTQLMWFDRTGRALGSVGEPAEFMGVSVSPDRRRVTAAVRDSRGGPGDIWSYDIESGRRIRLTADRATESTFTWSPDGRRIAFGARGTPVPSLIVRHLDGSAAEQTVAMTPLPPIRSGPEVSDWSPEGLFILASAGGELWMVPLDGSSKPSVWAPARDKSARTQGQFDPTGRWIAYQSNGPSGPEIYVAGFPTPGRPLQVSTKGGTSPRWRDDGREIFYIAPDGGLMAAAVNLYAGEFAIGPVQPLFRTHHKVFPGQFGWPYDVRANGTQFLINTFGETPAPATLTVVLNWSPTQ